MPTVKIIFFLQKKNYEYQQIQKLQQNSLPCLLPYPSFNDHKNAEIFSKITLTNRLMHIAHTLTHT